MPCLQGVIHQSLDRESERLLINRETDALRILDAHLLVPLLKDQDGTHVGHAPQTQDGRAVLPRALSNIC
eukprot:3384680-Pyramimonas_sp.AAC.1